VPEFEMREMEVKEFLVKTENVSYMHVEWLSEDEMTEKFGPFVSRQIKRYETLKERIEGEVVSIALLNRCFVCFVLFCFVLFVSLFDHSSHPRRSPILSQG
jgi:hypothetical protein